NSVKVTIPEGFDINKIALKLQEAGLVEKEAFINSVKDYAAPEYIKSSKDKKYNIEGFLFPDTYSFKKGSSNNEIIEKMMKRFEEVLEESEKELNKSVSKDKIEETIIIASMIEKEARNKEEMPIIASVMKNRINKKMPLQIDATVLYALGTHKEIVTYKDLEVNSPYNTYKIPSLPAGPIASPGKEAIKAAINPAETNYLYYLYDKKGSHFFTADYNEFLKKKNEFGY
ncbi:endolytic transglycosylase MltG, partial [Clostridium polynesiense]|uniref:endolytic transglycosylase MltG n=1 Tax=Clostridium polynesiense TaxID=1325933 RepID=UPI0005916457